MAFIPDFNVKNSQLIYPAADLSEQISTAGNEASGTGNMKLSLNGALTIGTLDGANVEILERVGAENFFCFGLTFGEIANLRTSGYDPAKIASSNPELQRILDHLVDGTFSPGNVELFRPLVENLKKHDPYFVLADFPAYVGCQEKVSAAYMDPDHWSRMSILNGARMGYFSSDRGIRDNCRDICKVDAVAAE